MSTIDFATVLAVAIERAAFSQPGPDGRMAPDTAADVAAILGYEEPEGDDEALAYAWDEPLHPRESEAHDGKKPGEFAPGQQGDAPAGGEESDEDDEPDEAAQRKAEYDAALEEWGKAHDEWAARDDLHRDLPDQGPDADDADDAERRADSSDYRAALKEYHGQFAAARDTFLKDELEPWKEAAKAYEQYEQDHGDWEERDTDRTARKGALDEADVVGAAAKEIESTWEQSPAPDWDLSQDDAVGHYLAQVTPFAESFAKGWDAHFDAEGPALAALKELGVDEKGLAKFDRAAAKGRAALDKPAARYKAAAGKYLDYQARADEAKAKFEAMVEPESPDEPTLEEPLEPDRDEFQTDEEYETAQSAYEAEKEEYDTAWNEYEKADNAHQKADAAYQKASSRVDAMEEQAEKLAGRMDDDKESLESAWSDSLATLKEEQDDGLVKAIDAVDKEAEDDEEPDEPDAPGDEPEFEPPEPPDPAEYDPDEEPAPPDAGDYGPQALSRRQWPVQYGWDESQHPRGQPENAGEFAAGRNSAGAQTTPPAPPPAPAAVQDKTPHAAQAEQWTAGTAISDELKKEYAGHMEAVLGKMPEGFRKAALEAIAEFGGSMNFHGSIQEVTAALEKSTGKKERSKVGGFVEHYPGGDAIQVHLDGGAGTTPGETAQGIYSHEMGHAADVGRKFSTDPKWQSVWKSEIKGGRTLLSRYAMVSATEGFAELHRALCDKGVEAVRAKWPKCCAFLAAKGLI